ncbi:MAG: hypothetical protein NDF58_08705 [archaeon YNP-LCB-024-027]|nr:hypothetical protein [Candidatus Culexarchaeum yellowstonense]
MIEVNKLIKILRLPTAKLFQDLKKRPYAIAGKHYVLWHRGDGLPCLVAHIDHVYEEKGWGKRPILYNEEYLWSPMGIAGDDRAGVYAVMKLFSELEVNALFTDGEERGAIGAWEACDCSQLVKTPYFIEIDRRGYKEAVFYNEEEELVPEFTKVISKHFTIGKGSFSDISILGQCFNVASVNLSAGFYNEHQRSAEYIYIPSLEYTIRAVPKLISELGDKRYELPDLFLWSNYSYYSLDRGKGKGKKKKSLLWWYEPEEIEEGDRCPIECWNCGALDWDRVVGYWCWNLEDSPDPEQPNCIRKKLMEVEPWV